MSFTYLYKGIPVVSLNHNKTFTESCGVGGVKSQDRFTLFPIAAQTSRAGTKLYINAIKCTYLNLCQNLLTINK